MDYSTLFYSVSTILKLALFVSTFWLILLIINNANIIHNNITIILTANITGLKGFLVLVFCSFNTVPQCTHMIESLAIIFLHFLHFLNSVVSYVTYSSFTFSAITLGSSKS